jgi:hypothetical protein
MYRETCIDWNIMITISILANGIIHARTYSLRPQLSVVFGFCARKFDSICIKYVQHLYLQINLLKN